MKVKRFVVDSMPVAMQQIRVELGEQAVILNTKEIKTGGFLGIFQKRQFEVIAAAPQEKEKGAQKAAAVPSAPSKEKEYTPPMPSVPSIEKPKVPEKRTEANEDILQELRSVKEMLVGIVAGDSGSDQVPQPLAPWVQRLKEQEVDPPVIQYLVERLLREGMDRADEKQIQQALREHITSMLTDGSLGAPEIAPSVNLVSFVGPTGVGKTTTIAKLAADQILNYQRRVGLLTTDTYRIAAVEQLKTYANILNVPIETAFSPDGLKKSMKNLRDRDLIFMDTTGRNYLDEQGIQEISRYLSEPLIQENYLVLGMTSKYSDIKKIIDNFKVVPIDKIILTKRDETSSYGIVLNLAYHYPYPLAYITTGQNVPEDIEKVQPEELANLILGVTEHDGSSPTS